MSHGAGEQRDRWYLERSRGGLEARRQERGERSEDVCRCVHESVQGEARVQG